MNEERKHTIYGLLAVVVVKKLEMEILWVKLDGKSKPLQGGNARAGERGSTYFYFAF